MPKTLLPPQLEISEVNSVQELAIHGCEPPLRYVHKDEITDASRSSSIPVIDLRLIFSESVPIEAKQQEMDNLRTALSSWGFFQAIGHGIPNSLLDDVRKASKEFFDMPLEEKRKYSVDCKNKEHETQGYGNDQIIAEQSIDWSDRLYLLVKPQEKRNMSFWPDDPKNFREVLHEYSIKTSLLAENIVKAMAEVVGLKEDCFLSQFGEDAPMYARINYYPPCAKRNLIYGLKPHSDGGGITILLQDEEVEGLQVLKDGEWMKVPVIPHAFVVNIADQMEIMSNGLFKSAVHRVVPDSEKERISLAMFFSPHFEGEIGPADGLIDETRPRLFKKLKVKDYVETFLQKFFQGKRAIDSAKF